MIANISESPIAADKYIVLYTDVYMYVYVENIYPYVPSKQLLVFKIADRLPLSLHTSM